MAAAELRLAVEAFPTLQNPRGNKERITASIIVIISFVFDPALRDDKGSWSMVDISDLPTADCDCPKDRFFHVADIDIWREIVIDDANHEITRY